LTNIRVNLKNEDGETEIVVKEFLPLLVPKEINEKTNKRHAHHIYKY